MSDPVLVEVLRGESVESRHVGAFAVCDTEGRVVASAGDIDKPVFPRSAVKALQALPLLESGAAERYALSNAEIALAVSSHNGEARHVDAAAAMLAKLGRDAASLECGAHWPYDKSAANRLVREGRAPSALHNNCSGKHAGFICTACAEGLDPKGYISARHPVMRAVMGVMNEMADAALDGDTVGIDGCSIPTQAAPLKGLARAFARFGTGAHLEPGRAKAAARIRQAVAAEPFMIAGSGEFCTEVTELFRERLFVKLGAEGVFCATFPEQGLGVALKCGDGATRASQLIMAALIARFLPMSEAEREALQPFLAPKLHNWNGVEIGRLRAAGPLVGASRYP